MRKQKYLRVLDYWFGNHSNDLDVIKEKSSLWWGKNSATDQDITARFGNDLERAIKGDYNDWIDQPQGRLALIILIDQFSRNIYRNTAKAFAQDALALSLCVEGINHEFDIHLRPVQRLFFYLPLEHSESLEHQKKSLECYTGLNQSIPPEYKKAFSGFLDFAVKHHAIIERFGRFPHRNTILGRTSTAEEVAFLKQPGSSF